MSIKGKSSHSSTLHRSVKLSSEDLQDAELIFKTANGNLSAFEQLYHRYYKRLFQFCYRLSGRLDMIEEIINDVFFLIWTKAESYNRLSRPSSWIFGIAYNKSLSHCRQNKMQVAEILVDEIDEHLIPGPDHWLTLLEKQNWLEIAFQYLSPEQRAVLELTYWHGLHYQEIAELMDCPENTVKTRMFYARKRLAAVLLRDQPDTLNTSGER